MTKQEAINILTGQYRVPVENGTDEFAQEINKAIDMAIEALQAESKTGKWKLDPNGMDWNIPAWRCSECGFVANYIGVEVNGLGDNPMNWAGSNFCPNCGADMREKGKRMSRYIDANLISRQAAIEAVEKAELKEVAKAAIKSLPSVEPPKKVVAQVKVDIDEIIERIKEEYEIKDKPLEREDAKRIVPKDKNRL